MTREQEIERLVGELAACRRNVAHLQEQSMLAEQEFLRVREQLEELRGDKPEKRYLTMSELLKLSDHAHEPLTSYLRDSRNHDLGSGACLEVSLTRREAQQVDTLCELLGIGNM